MAKLQLKEHEQAFNIKPVGVKYICEICNDGEMIVDHLGETLMTNPPLIPHKCNKCNSTMHLPKQYPYIEWVPEDNNEE